MRIEFSPGLLLSGNDLTVESYNKKKLWYRLRISGATKRLEGESGPSQIAVGLRLSLIDESDLRANKGKIQSATAVADTINKIYVAARKRAGPPPAKIISTPQEEKMIKYYNKKIKEAWTEEKWNAKVFDIAFALRAMSADSAGNNLKTDLLNAWVTYGFGFGSTAQWLFGGNAGYNTDSEKFDWTLSSRFYIGTNKLKAFLEAQTSEKESMERMFLLNSGGEIGIANDLWLVFSVGTERSGETKRWNTVTNFQFKFGFPGTN